MSAVAHSSQHDTVSTPEPAVLWAIADAERRLADLFSYCERLHQMEIAHDSHSCVLCFEQR
jgi:hypothetical protein